METTYRTMNIIFEVERSFKYFRRGLAEVQGISGRTSFYDPVLLFLASGFERLFKAMLCLNYKERKGMLPEPGELWNLKKGHDILDLKSKVELVCLPIDRPYGQSDYELITKDEIINLICELLGEFAQGSRYFNLDAVLGRKQRYNSERAWESLETTLMKASLGEVEYYKKLGNPKMLDELYSLSNRGIVIYLEKILKGYHQTVYISNLFK